MLCSHSIEWTTIDGASVCSCIRDGEDAENTRKSRQNEGQFPFLILLSIPRFPSASRWMGWLWRLDQDGIWPCSPIPSNQPPELNNPPTAQCLAMATKHQNCVRLVRRAVQYIDYFPAYYPTSHAVFCDVYCCVNTTVCTSGRSVIN